MILSEEENAYNHLVRSSHEVETPQESEYTDIPSVFLSRARSCVATRVVEKVREKLKTMTHGPKESDQDCSVCFALSGRKVVDHRAGSDECPNGICYEDEKEWKRFTQVLLRFPENYLCFSCFLPTVSLMFRSPPLPKSRVDLSRSLSLLHTPQARKANAPGALWHKKAQCTLPHLIRPAIYAFWVKAPILLRNHVSSALGVEWQTLEQFSSWCISFDEVNGLFNHILLFACIMYFWNSRD